MDTLIITVVFVTVFVAVVLLPLWVAFIIRLIFKQSNSSTVILLVASAFALYTTTRLIYSDILPPLNEDGTAQAFKYLLFAMCLLLSFGFSHLLARSGILLSDFITRKKSQHAPPAGRGEAPRP
jgi:H+/gluconate symporter-like permease